MEKKARSEKTKPTSFDDLPNETATEILLRLPVKALIRSTSVNKKWYSLIKNPYFISTQIKLSISHFSNNAVLIVPPIISQQNYCSLVEAETGSVIENFEIPFNTRSNSLKLIASVKGLLLLTDLHVGYVFRDLYLWNPCVRRHILLVSSCFKKIIDDRKKWNYIVGLGYHEGSNDFRVVRVFYDMDNAKRFNKVVAKVEIFSMKERTWRKLKDPVVPIIGSGYGIFFKGKYYWLEIENEPEEEVLKDLWILSFDFDNEVFEEFKVPDGVSNSFGPKGTVNLMEFEGSICFCVSRAEHMYGVVIRYHYSIWLMRQESDARIWTLHSGAILKKGGFPMNITKSGTLIFETYPLDVLSVTRILSCNLNTVHYQDLGYCKRGGVEVSPLLVAPCTVDTYFVESLVMFEGGKSALNYA